MFVAFFIFLQHLPIRYRTFVYKRSEYPGSQKLADRMCRDILGLFRDNLSLVQSFDTIKVYYDGGQEIVTAALHNAIGEAVSKEAAVYRSSTASEYRLAQAADMICTLELANHKYRAHESTNTDEKFFGSFSAFKNNYMKALKRKRI